MRQKSTELCLRVPVLFHQVDSSIQTTRGVLTLLLNILPACYKLNAKVTSIHTKTKKIYTIIVLNNFILSLMMLGARSC